MQTVYRRKSCLTKEQINILRENIRQLQYQQLLIAEYLLICGDGKSHIFPFFKILQENKSLRKSYEDFLFELQSNLFKRPAL